MTSRPRSVSTRQSSGSGSRPSRLARLPAIDLMGASELFSSCPSTRTRRCHACNSCSLRAWVKSEITTSSSGSPRSRMRVRRTPQRPAPPGKAFWMVLWAAPSRQCSSSSATAVRPSSCSAGAASSRSPARFTRRRRRCSSKAKTATSISRITARTSRPASSAPNRCSCRVLPSRLTSRITPPRASSGRGARPRMEKSPSRSAPSRFATVCSEYTTRSRTASTQPIHTTRTTPVTAHSTRPEKFPDQTSHSATADPGSPAARASSTIRPSWLTRAIFSSGRMGRFRVENGRQSERLSWRPVPKQVPPHPYGRGSERKRFTRHATARISAGAGTGRCGSSPGRWPHGSHCRRSAPGLS